MAQCMLLASSTVLSLLHKKTNETNMVAVVSQVKADTDVSPDVFRYTVLDNLPPRQEVF